MISLAGSVSGSLYYWRDPIQADAAWALPERVDEFPLRPVGWSQLELRTSSPLVRGEPPGLLEYRYPFLLRRSGAHLLLVGSDSDIVPFLLKELRYSSRLTAPVVDVVMLAAELAKRPGEYCLGVVWARVDGFGESLRTIALFGSDLAEARLFLDLLPLMRPFRVTLKHVRSGADILSIGAGGGVSFGFHDQHSLRDVDACLAYLNRRRLVAWETPLAEAGKI